MSNSITGEARDVETIARLRPWLEDEARAKYGYKGKTELLTEYNKEQDIFKFTILFNNES